MPRNGSGVYSPPAANYPAVSGTTITAANRNGVDADIATALTNSLAVNGESVVTANIPMSGNKLTGLGAATARTDAASLANIQDGTGVYSGTVGGTADVITITPSPAITSYTGGQSFSFIASGANTTNVTINVNGLGAKAITKNGTTALAAGDIPSGFLVTVRYDGTRFQLVGAKDAFNGGTVTNDIIVPDEAYGVGWNASLEVPTKNAVYDKVETLAPLASPTFTGTPTLPTGTIATTQSVGDSSTKVATTAFFQANNIVLGATTATTSGTSVDFTGLSASAKRHTFLLAGVSLSGTDRILVQLMDSGGAEATGYLGNSACLS